MYLKYFALRAPPFALPPDPAFMFQSRAHRQALAMLRYGVASQVGFCLLTGEVGCGKTLLVRQLMRLLEQSACVGLLNNTHRRFDRLMQWVCLAFGIDAPQQDEVELHRQFEKLLVREYAAGRCVLLIVDEAQNLDVELLEELRVLSNVNADRRLMLQTFLVGQPELRETLRLPCMRQFAQRIGIDYHLGMLDPEDTLAYVRHRLAVAGGDPELFSREAVRLVQECSMGVPRLINQLCETALVYGFADQQPIVDAALMRQVIADRIAGGIFPGRPPAETVSTARLQ